MVLLHQKSEYNELGKELRIHGTALFPIAHYDGNWKEDSVQLHWHEEFEAGYITAGQVELCVGKEKTILSKGDGFFINSGIPHAFLDAGNAESQQRSMVFDPSLVGGRHDSIYWQKYVQPILFASSKPWFYFESNIAWHKDAVHAIKSAWRCCDQTEFEYEFDVRKFLSHLLALISRQLPNEHPTQARRITRDNERIKIMMKYIQDHRSEKLTTSDIAKSASISTSECLRCFHNTIGLTPIQYTKLHRIQRAAHLLQTTDHLIADIGANCGFQEMSYFAKSFREIIGVTPSEYKKNLKEKDAT